MIPYLDLFIKYCNLYSVPLPLALAIAKVESNFNPNVKRYEPHLKTTSYGLFQILETTAKELGFKKPKFYLKHPLLDPETNINYGIKHISNLMKKYKNIEDVIASYNMGYPRPASQSTPITEKIFGKPQITWKYANQPYVDRVLKWYNYYSKKLPTSNIIIDNIVFLFLIILFFILKKRIKK